MYLGVVDDITSPRQKRELLGPAARVDFEVVKEM